MSFLILRLSVLSVRLVILVFQVLYFACEMELIVRVLCGLSVSRGDSLGTSGKSVQLRTDGVGW